MDILKRSAYIKGLIEGLEIEESTSEGKVLCKIVELLDDICEEISDIKENVEEVWDVVDDIDEELQSLEEDVFSDLDCNFNEFFCVKCPKCGKEHFIHYKDLTENELEEGKIKCPDCKGQIDLDECLVLSEDVDGCDCGCGKVSCDCDDGNCNCDE